MNTEREPQHTTDATDYPELNAVLGKLVADVQAILAENFCGAYLQGSFALGEADEHSDVDFVIVTRDKISKEQLAQLQAMHKRIYALDVPWAQHLEGSYVSREQVRHVDPSRAPYPYLDNGASRLEADNHCNTAVVRWLLREYGVVLAGPEPKSLIDPIPAEQLRREALAGIDEYAAWAPEPTEAGAMSRWKQPYLVLTFCRLLNTLETGRVVSKQEAAEWALGALDAEWASLIERALDERADPWTRVHEPADGEAVGQTLAFATYALHEGAARHAQAQ
ncbi:MAG TPA: aminoglycoside adenylyltransferase domain-containing protein [Gaiellaceae bacterium]|nr:aminoglycoside adenylyltransferase domain-containing protein [Gaiellaceae bacterium]